MHSSRNKGRNEGRFALHGPQAAQDGYDLVEWIAGQPGCNGNVAMMGASGYGIMQWKTAPPNPPHLKALVVPATTDNCGGLCYPGGMLREPLVLGLVSRMTTAAISPGPISGKEPPICHDPKFPSHLLLPLIPEAPEIEPVKPPSDSAVPGAARFTQWLWKDSQTSRAPGGGYS